MRLLILSMATLRKKLFNPGLRKKLNWGAVLYAMIILNINVKNVGTNGKDSN